MFIDFSQITALWVSEAMDFLHKGQTILHHDMCIDWRQYILNWPRSLAYRMAHIRHRIPGTYRNICGLDDFSSQYQNVHESSRYDGFANTFWSNIPDTRKDENLVKTSVFQFSRSQQIVRQHIFDGNGRTLCVPIPTQHHFSFPKLYETQMENIPGEPN